MNAKYVKIVFYGNNNNENVEVAEVRFLNNGTVAEITNPGGGNNMTWIIVGVVCGVVVIAAAATLVIILKRRKNNV